MAQAKKSRILWTAILVLAAVLSFHEISFSSEAVKYPERDITCIVVFRPGGGTDIIGRAAAPYLRKYLPKPVNVVVQNIDAAGGRVGTFKIYDSKPDGYTIGLLEPTVFVLAEAMGEMGKRDMMHMTWMPRTSSQPYIMAVSPQSPIKNAKDLKGKRVRASVSQATLACSVAVLRYLGADPQVIVYGGGAESCLATMRGDTDVVIQVAATVLRQAEASGGKLIPVCVFTEKRLAVAPSLPTAKEVGADVPEDLMVLLSHDYVYAAPPNLPADLNKVLNEAIEKTLRDPAFNEDIKKAKLTVDMLSSAEVRKRISNLANVMPQYMEAVRKALPK